MNPNQTLFAHLLLQKETPDHNMQWLEYTAILETEAVTCFHKCLLVTLVWGFLSLSSSVVCLPLFCSFKLQNDFPMLPH